MGSPYQSQSASSYNSSPPPDDGTTTSSNKITWAGIKTKLADSVKTLADAINSALRTALNVSPSTTSVNYTTAVTDHITPIECTGSITISLGDAATMVSQSMGYEVSVVNKGAGLVTVGVATAADTLNSVANGTVTLPPWTSARFGVNQAGSGYNILGTSRPYAQGADIVSASTVNLDGASAGDYVHITGTTTITAITLQKGSKKVVVLDGALTLTNGASLILPGAANITTAAGDTAIFRGEASGVVRCIAYVKASGKAVVETFTVATQADQETATSTTAGVTSGRQQFHPSAAKFWLQADSAGAMTSSYNMTSVTDTGTGVIGGTINVDFSSANWCGVVSTEQGAGAFRLAELVARAAGTFSANCYDNAASSADPTYWHFAGFGDQ